jgi:hypothetical protein
MTHPVATVVLLLALSLLLPVRGWAAFTDAEQASLLALHRAWNQLQSVMSDYTAVTTSKYVTAANHQAVGAATGGAVRAIGELNDAIGILLGVSPVASQAEREAFDPLTRARRLDLAFWRLDRTLMQVEAARKAWADLGKTAEEAEFQDWARRVGVGLATAALHVRKVDRGLPYADPYPNPPSANGSRLVVGPHGDYDAVQWSLWRSVVYFTRAMGSLARAVTLGSPGHDYARMGRPYMSLAQMNRNSVAAMFIFSGVTPTDKSRFWHVLEGVKLLTTQEYPGTPMQGHFIHFEWKTLWAKFGRSPAWDAAVIDAMVITADAWKHSDHAAWMLMVFPDCAVVRDQQGCGGRTQ